MAKTLYKKMIYVCSPCRPTLIDPPLRVVQKEMNLTLAKLACMKVIDKGWIPVAPHLYFTQFLDDETPEERELGMELGLAVLNACDEVWVVTDDVISDGMMKEIEEAAVLGIPVKMFDSKWKENPNIQDLVQMLRQEALDSHGDESGDEPEEDEDDADDHDDPCEGCDGCSENDEFHKGSIDDLVDSIIDRVFKFADSDMDSLEIRIIKPDIRVRGTDEKIEKNKKER